MKMTRVSHIHTALHKCNTGYIFSQILWKSNCLLPLWLYFSIPFGLLNCRLYLQTCFHKHNITSFLVNNFSVSHIWNMFSISSKTGFFHFFTRFSLQKSAFLVKKLRVQTESKYVNTVHTLTRGSFNVSEAIQRRGRS